MANTIKKSELRNYIREIPDFPKKGILFYDVTTLLQNKDAFKKSVDLLANKFKKQNIDLVAGVDARGFIFGAAIAYKLGVAFVPIRKKGKLPYKTKSLTYSLEYGTDTVEVHEDAIPAESKVLVIDDLLATGGTIKAVTDLIKEQKASIVGVGFLVELKFLKGRNKIKDFNIYSLIKY